MNQKEVFKRVAEHLITQNSRSGPNSGAKYKAADGKSCAIGCLLTDAAYNTTLEDRCVDNPPVVRAVQDSLEQEITKGDLELLTKLQVIHDQEEVEDWQFCLNELSLHWFETPLDNVLQEN